MWPISEVREKLERDTVREGARTGLRWVLGATAGNLDRVSWAMSDVN